ncbi:MAG: hypothetical protein KIT24_04190 [Phycisphaeraceae bacterium]|nr:hypothetical protein [Phycisphaeraceae bacterium]
MNLDPAIVRRLAVIAAIAPCLAVGMARLISSAPAPAAARAAAPQQRAAEKVPPPKPLSAAQKAALAYASAIELPVTEPSPFHEPLRELKSQAPEIEELDILPTPPHWWRVTSIISGRKPIAVINGRPMAIGDVVDDGWTVLRIDPHGRLVTIAKDGIVAILEQTAGR